jgi:gas vesicle protein
MSDDNNQSKLLLGILVGAGVGFAAGLLLAPRQRTRLRGALIDGAREAVERVSCLARGPNAWYERKTAREARTLADRIERMRSAGL